MITEYKLIAGTKEELIEYYSFVDGENFKWCVDSPVTIQLDNILSMDKIFGFIQFLEWDADGSSWVGMSDGVLIRK